MKLIDQYKELHKDKDLYTGSALEIHAQSIKQGLAITGSNSILDFGCGKGIQYSKENLHTEYFFGIMPSLYDPGVEEYSKLPKGNFDAVISTDVLEHIEEEDVDAFIKQLFSKAEKFVYLGICNKPANSILPDGRNAHVTLKSFDWWLDKILPYADVYTMVYVYGDIGDGGKAIIDDGKITTKKQR